MARRKAKRSLGQNFLVQPGIVQSIVEQISSRLPAFAGHVTEIGPGAGALTHALLARCEHITLLEKDDAYAAEWEQVATQLRPGQMNVIHGDALEWTPPEHPVFLIGNLPFNMATAIYGKLLTTCAPSSEIILMFQKEVGQRLLAPPGSARGSLSVWAQLHGPITKLMTIPPSAFRPQPKVAGILLHQVLVPPPNWKKGQFELLDKLLRLSFASRRKILGRKLQDYSIQGIPALEHLGLASSARAEELTNQNWVDLVEGCDKTLGCDGRGAPGH